MTIESFTSFGNPERKWIVVSYFTINTGYAKEVYSLITSLERFKLNHHVEGIESRGSWLRNVKARPMFLMKMLNLFPDLDIVWLDADAVVMKDPRIFDDLHGSDFDIAVHYLRGRELLGGTLWLNNREKSKTLLTLWDAESDKEQYLKEQINLQVVLKAHSEFKTFILPAAYTKIFDIMRAEPESVIIHNQASRRFKRIVGITMQEKQHLSDIIRKESAVKAP